MIVLTQLLLIKAKKELLSAFDPNDLKKCKSYSLTSLAEPTASSTAQITLSDEDLQIYGNIISHNFQDQIKTIVTDAVESIVKKINNRLDFLENENKNLKSRVSDFEAKLIEANESQDKANQYKSY
jgi:chaperonin cofactor prefoldin